MCSSPPKFRNTSDDMVETQERKDQRKKSKTKEHYLRQVNEINGENKFEPTPLTIWEGSKDDGRWTSVIQLSRLGNVTPRGTKAGVRANPVRGVVAKNDQDNHFHIEQKFMKRLLDNFVSVKQSTHANAKGSNAKQLTGNIGGYVLVQWLSNNEEVWTVPLLIEPFDSTRKRKSNRPDHFVPGGSSNVPFMIVDYLNERQHRKQFLHGCKELGWELDTKEERDAGRGGCDEEKDEIDKRKEKNDDEKDEREGEISTASSVSLAMDRIPKKDGDSQYTRDLVHLSLIYLAISRARRCESISEEFDRAVGIEGQHNNGKYVNFIVSYTITNLDGVRAAKEREKWENRKQPCKIDNCSTLAHNTSQEGYCLKHDDKKQKCSICKVRLSRRKGGLCNQCFHKVYDPSNAKCYKCNLHQPRKFGGLCRKCVG